MAGNKIKMCKPMYKLGIAMLIIGIVSVIICLVIALLGKGWIAFFIAFGFCVIAIIMGQISELYLVKHLKLIDESLTPKQAHLLAVQHLRDNSEDADDTEVFLGKFIEDTSIQNNN